MDREGFLDILIKDNYTGNNELLNHIKIIRHFIMVPPESFYDSFTTLLINLSDRITNITDRDLLVTMLYNLTNEIMGDLGKIILLSNIEYYSRVYDLINAINTLEYTLIDKSNNDYDIIKEIVKDLE